MGFRIAIDQELCVSSGRCVAEEPSLFSFDDDELAAVVHPEPDVDERRVLSVARQCPGRAIVVRDAAGEVVELD
jgi:ferredoxin